MSTQPAVAVKPGRDELDKEHTNLLILLSVTLDAILFAGGQCNFVCMTLL